MFRKFVKHFGKCIEDRIVMRLVQHEPLVKVVEAFHMMLGGVIEVGYECSIQCDINSSRPIPKVRIGSYGHHDTYRNVGVDGHWITFFSGNATACVVEFTIVLGDGVQKVAVGKEIGNSALYVTLRARGNYGLRDQLQNKERDDVGLKGLPVFVMVRETQR